jgi:putative transposase
VPHEEYYERNLPHWYPEGRTIFIACRLYGSLPQSLSQRLLSNKKTPSQQFVQFDRNLDQANYGPRWLEESQIAELVVASLQKGSAELNHYSLRSFVVMANHVHLLIDPQAPLSTIMKGLKGATARSANKLLGRTGKSFWQDESFDHWVRDEAEEQKVRHYIETNPVKAGLVDRAEDWPWSSAKK